MRGSPDARGNRERDDLSMDIVAVLLAVALFGLMYALVRGIERI